jgi:peptidase E
MRKILLTSSGFDSNNVLEIFKSLFNKSPVNIKALFVPTAAIFPEAISVLPECMNDLLNAGIPSENIRVFDLHRNMEYSKLSQYDVIYFTGGDSRYLLDRINDTGFNKPLCEFVDNGGIYVGVSAGSIVATNEFHDSLKLINCTLNVHAANGTKAGDIDVTNNPHIDLKDGDAILILGDKCEIVR